jgi:hypothetical protein
MTKIKVFTNNDLDGAGSLMLLKWALGDRCEIDHTVSNIFNIRRDYERFDSDEVSMIFILNMTPDFEVCDKVKVFSKAEALDVRFRGKVAPSVSTTDLIRKFFKDSLSHLTPNQEKLIDTIHALYVDGGQKKESMKLNAIFSYGRNKYSAFYDRFENGLDDYTKEEETIIGHYSAKLAKTYKALEMYEHSRKKGVYIALVSDMSNKHEILDLLFKKHSPKIVFLVDLQNGFISVRKNDSVEMDMHKLCASLIQGRALKNCAGGRYTEKFLDFSRAFM